MSTLTAPALLQAWDLAQGEVALRRPSTLLEAAWPDVDPRAWGAMPIGLRDAWLVTLHESLFGHEVDTVVDCPACSEPLESSFATAVLRSTQPAEPEASVASSVVRCDGYELAYRLPSTEDLLELAGDRHATPAAAVIRLLERCVQGAQRDGQPAAVGELPPSVVDRLQQEMALRDPGADARIALACSACGHGFERRFDIATYLWEALDDWAQRTLAEVHVLASSYGWSEPQILALSSSRRQHYISLVQA